jgi:hypothetical protein
MSVRLSAWDRAGAGLLVITALLAGLWYVFKIQEKADQLDELVSLYYDNPKAGIERLDDLAAWRRLKNH